MSTYRVNTTDGIIRGVSAKTDATLQIVCKNPDGTTKTISGYAFRGTVRVSEGGRVLKQYSTGASGGLSVTSACAGLLTATVDNSDLPYAPHAVLEVVEYSGGSVGGDETERFRFFFPILGGNSVGY